MVCLSFQATLPSYDRIVVDPNFEGAYQITSADLNGDNRPDLVAVSDRLSEIRLV